MHGKSCHIYLDPENANLKHTGTACTVQFATSACKNRMKLRTQLHQTARPEPLRYDLHRPLAKHTGALHQKLTDLGTKAAELNWWSVSCNEFKCKATAFKSAEAYSWSTSAGHCIAMWSNRVQNTRAPRKQRHLEQPARSHYVAIWTRHLQSTIDFRTTNWQKQPPQPESAPKLQNCIFAALVDRN